MKVSAKRKRTYRNVLELIGNTPLVEINKINPNKKVKILAKLERFNPGGSVKDRIGIKMIESAERRGELTKEKTILEATSGNTGIGLALVAAVKGYKIEFVMSESVSIERKRMLKAFGAKLFLSPAEEKTDGAIKLAQRIYHENPGKYFMPDQFKNEENVNAHYETTAEEIWQDTEGKITHFVAGMGTTGTIMGVSKKLKKLNKRIRIVGVEPNKNYKIQGLKNMDENIVPAIYMPELIDNKINIDDEGAFEMTRRLAREEGMFVGMSSGAAMHIAVELAKKLKGGMIVVLLPDGGEKYLSTTVFNNIGDEKHDY